MSRTPTRRRTARVPALLGDSSIGIAATGVRVLVNALGPITDLDLVRAQECIEHRRTKGSAEADELAPWFAAYQAGYRMKALTA